MNGIIFYTDSRIGEPIASKVREYIEGAGLPITSVSLKRPLAFGENFVVQGERSYPTMVKQILTALEMSKCDNVFFCEHDVLYHPSHFDFTPLKDNIFYYNDNVWRWWYGNNKAIRHCRMLPLSSLCVNRLFALEHYKKRQQKIEEWGLDVFRSREPRLARIWGYEPGTKKMRRGGFSDDDYDTWHSKFPVIDIRHRGTFSSPKITLDSFKHKPSDWEEIPIDDIEGWSLREMFKL